MLKATVRHAGEWSFLGKSNSNHWVVMDGSPKIGAEDGGARPKELLLLALGGCTAFDVKQVLDKRRVKPDAFEVALSADESEEHPMVLTRVRMEYRFRGEIPVADIERAVRLSFDKYCAVTAMLRQVFPIEWRALLNGQEVLAGSTEPVGQDNR
ncbi:MAG TPA: OsmC family protein [bacterium]|nr:OsmC family protein [bacterium]